MNVTHYYKYLFADFEDKNILDLDDAKDLWCLHYTFLPCINNHLQMFLHGLYNDFKKHLKYHG